MTVNGKPAKASKVKADGVGDIIEISFGNRQVRWKCWLCEIYKEGEEAKELSRHI